MPAIAARSFAALLLAAAVLPAVGAHAQSATDAVSTGRFTADEENDFFSPKNQDRHYTQGLRLSYLSPELGSVHTGLDALLFGNPAPSADSATAPLTSLSTPPSVAKRWSFEFAQVLFTPQNKTLAVPDSHDRPYAGWLYGGFNYYIEHDQDDLQRFAIKLGVVGPSAQGAQTQNRFHLAIDVATAQGWRFQLHDEPAAVLDYDRRWRAKAEFGDGFGVDVIPSVTAEGGNVYDYVGVGGMVRIGRNLGVDYGPARIDPGPTGTDYFNDKGFSAGRLGFYLFAGTEGRAVARNIFLDGNTFRTSASVDKNIFVGDLTAGATIYYGEWAKLSYAYLMRSTEFRGQKDPDQFGTITASIVLPF